MTEFGLETKLPAASVQTDSSHTAKLHESGYGSGIPKSPETSPLTHLEIQGDVAAPRNVIWNEIGQFDVMKWHPDIQSGQLFKNAADGSQTRELLGTNGATFDETCVHAGDDYLQYHMTKGLPTEPTTTLHAEPDGKGGTHVDYTVDVDLSKLPADAAKSVTQGLTGFYQDGINKLQKVYGKD